MQLTEEQEAALARLEAGESIFLTGGAGTGKTSVINEFIRRNPERGIVRLGTTGGAAQLINGQTLHRFFRLGGRIHTPYDLTMPGGLARKIRAAKCVIVEEISMARIDHFQVIRDRLLGAPRGIGDFGAHQLVVVGDFSQLPPVVTPTEIKPLEKLYGEDKHFAFQNRYWKHLQHIELREIHRQSVDDGLAAWLNQLRTGRAPDLDYINARVGAPPAGATHLVATNKAAQAINGLHMERLPAGRYRIEGKVAGAFPEAEMRVPPLLLLKPGSQVIICANDPENAYVNGSTGVLQRCERDNKGAPVAVVELHNGKQVKVRQYSWEAVAYDVEAKEVARRVTGTYQQLPLLPGWAITMHRAQGMSIDTLHVDPRNCFTSGQAYVALSRATSLAGLTLEAPLREEHVMLDERVRAFMQQAAVEEVPA